MQVKINIELITLCISNNRNAQNRLYEILLPSLNVVCQRYLNDPSERSDVLQESFIHIFKNLQQFDVSKASFKTWASRITINNCLKNNTKRQKTATQDLVALTKEPKIDPTALKNLSNEELLLWMKKMPKIYYDVFNLYVVDGFSHQEISAILKIDIALSRQRLLRSKAWLKDKLPDDFRTLFSVKYN